MSVIIYFKMKWNKTVEKGHERRLELEGLNQQ